jgi:hypothetical protein
MRASVSCQGAGADAIGQIVYKWPKKYTQLVRCLCCPISALHGRHANLYKAGEFRCILAASQGNWGRACAALNLQECRIGRSRQQGLEIFR